LKNPQTVTGFIWLPLKLLKPLTSARAGWSYTEVFSNHVTCSFPLFLQVFVVMSGSSHMKKLEIYELALLILCVLS